MYTLITVDGNSPITANQISNETYAEIFTKFLSTIASPIIITPVYTVYKSETDAIYILAEQSGIDLSIALPDGFLKATTALDANYPGIDIEYAPRKQTSNNSCQTNPRILIEQPADKIEGPLRALIWSDPGKEDYTHEIEFNM